MPLVLSKKDYERLTIFTKVSGIFTFAAGSIMIVDHGRVWLGLGLLVAGIIITLAPVPMAMVRPEDLDDTPLRDGEFEVNE